MFDFIKSVLFINKTTPFSGSDFIHVQEKGAIPVPVATIEEAKTFVLSLNGVFNFTKSTGRELPQSLPDHVREFFREYESVDSSLAELNLSLSEVEFFDEVGLWRLEWNGTWEYELYCFPRADSKIGRSVALHGLDYCTDIYDSLWHYLWQFYLEFKKTDHDS